MTVSDLGSLTNTQTVSGSLGQAPAAAPQGDFTALSVPSFSPTDVYRFTLNFDSDLNAALTNLNGGDADLRIYRDVNNNGEIDQGVDTLVSSSTRSGTLDESITVGTQAAGNYLAEVSRVSGDVTYDLSLSTQRPSDLLPVEREIGNLNGTRAFRDAVNSGDTADVYRFSLDSNRNLTLSLTGLSADADVRLIRDTNASRTVDSGEEIARSAFGGSTNESIVTSLDPGDYFVQVYQFSGDTSYNLSLAV